MKVGIVVTSYRLPKHMICSFIGRHASLPAVIHAVTDKNFYIDGVTYHKHKPPRMETFSITRCSNIGISCAIYYGCDVIIKTDIDCIISNGCFDHMISATKEGQASIYRYWQVSESRDKEKMDPRCVGTCVMTASDWTKCGMYNEEMDGYGYDDADIIMRAQRVGIECSLYSEPKLYHIEHEKHNRDTCNPVKRNENKAKGRSARR